MQFLHPFPLAFKILEFISASNPIYQESYFLYPDFLPLLCHGYQSSPFPGHLLESTKINSGLAKGVHHAIPVQINSLRDAWMMGMCEQGRDLWTTRVSNQTEEFQVALQETRCCMLGADKKSLGRSLNFFYCKHELPIATSCMAWWSV